MKIIGWIREGDQTACGGTVAEGDQTCIGRGRAYAFQGARISCRKGCVIAEGFMRSMLANGRPRVIHGMKSSSGCPCYSTLNDIDGVGNESGAEIAEKHLLTADGEWAPVKSPEPSRDTYDERAQLVSPPIHGVPYYVETLDGRTFSGRTETDGLLPRIDTGGEDEYVVYWGDEALARMGGMEA